MLKKKAKSLPEKQEERYLKDLCRLLNIKFKEFNLQTIERRLRNYSHGNITEQIKRQIELEKNILIQNRNKIKKHYDSLKKNNKKQVDSQIIKYFYMKANNLIRTCKALKLGKKQTKVNNNSQFNNLTSGKLQTPKYMDAGKIVKRDIDKFYKNFQQKQVKQAPINKEDLNVLSEEMPELPDLSDVKKARELREKMDDWVTRCHQQILRQYTLKNKILKDEVEQQNKVISSINTKFNRLKKDLNQTITNLKKRNENIEQQIAQNLQNQINRIIMVHERLETALIKGIFEGNVEALLPLFKLYPNEHVKIYRCKPFIITYTNNNEECMKLLKEHLEAAMLSCREGIKIQLNEIKNSKINLVNYFFEELPVECMRLLGSENLTQKKQETANKDINLLLNQKIRQHMADYPKLKKEAAKVYKNSQLISIQKARADSLKKYLTSNLELMGDKFVPSKVDYRVEWHSKVKLHQKILENEKELREQINQFIQLTSSNNIYLDLIQPRKKLEEKIVKAQLEPLHFLAYHEEKQKEKLFDVPLSLKGFLRYMKIPPIFILAENYGLGKFKIDYALQYLTPQKLTIRYNFKVYFVSKTNKVLISKAKLKARVNKYAEICYVIAISLARKFASMEPFAYTALIYDTWYTKARKGQISAKQIVDRTKIKFWRNKVDIAQKALKDKYDKDIQLNKHLVGLPLRIMAEQKRLFLDLIHNVKECNRRTKEFKELCREFNINFNEVIGVEDKKILGIKSQEVCSSNNIQEILKGVNESEKQKEKVLSSFEQWLEETKKNIDNKTKDAKEELLCKTKLLAMQALDREKLQKNKKIKSLQEQAKEIIELNRIEVEQLPVEARKLVEIIQEQIFSSQESNDEYYRISRRFLKMMRSTEWESVNQFALKIVKAGEQQFEEANEQRIQGLVISLALMALSYGGTAYFVSTYSLGQLAAAAVQAAINTLGQAVITNDYHRLHEKFVKDGITNYLIGKIAEEVVNIKDAKAGINNTKDFKDAYEAGKISADVFNVKTGLKGVVNDVLTNVAHNKGKGSIKKQVKEGGKTGLVRHVIGHNVPDKIYGIDIKDVVKPMMVGAATAGVNNKLLNKKQQSTNVAMMQGALEAGVQAIGTQIGKNLGEKQKQKNNQEKIKMFKEKIAMLKKIQAESKKKAAQQVAQKEEDLVEEKNSVKKINLNEGTKLNQQSNTKKQNIQKAKKSISAKQNEQKNVNKDEQINVNKDEQKVNIFTAAKNQEKLISDNGYKKDNIKEEVKEKQGFWSKLGKNAMHCTVKVLDLVSMSGEAHGHEIPNDTKPLLEKENLQDLELINSKIHDKNNGNLNSASDFFVNGTNESMFLNLGYDIEGKYQEEQNFSLFPQDSYSKKIHPENEFIFKKKNNQNQRQNQNEFVFKKKNNQNEFVFKNKLSYFNFESNKKLMEEHNNSSILKANEFSEKWMPRVFCSAAFGNKNAKLEMRKRLPNVAMFTGFVDPNLSYHRLDSELMLNLKVRGRIVRNIGQSYYNVFFHPYDTIVNLGHLIREGVVLGADVIDATKYHVLKMKYRPEAKTRNQKRIDSLKNLWEADYLTKFEIVGTAAGSFMLAGGGFNLARNASLGN